jgi:hypothetical protein
VCVCVWNLCQVCALKSSIKIKLCVQMGSAKKKQVNAG